MGVRQSLSPVGRKSKCLNPGRRSTVRRRRREVGMAPRTATCGPHGDWAENWAHRVAGFSTPFQTCV